jgi:hypothetical protein
MMREILDQMAIRLLQKQPEDPVPHIVQFLEDLQGKGAAPLTA